MAKHTPALPGDQSHVSPAQFARASGLSLVTVRRGEADPSVQPAGCHGRILIPNTALKVITPAAATPPMHSPSPQSPPPERRRGLIPEWIG
jgi:hypothetical protein